MNDAQLSETALLLRRMGLASIASNESENLRACEVLLESHRHDAVYDPAELRGKGCSGRRLPEWIDDVVVSRYQGGEGTYQLAELLEISRPTICTILKRNGIELKAGRPRKTA